jgi:kinesin family member 13
LANAQISILDYDKIGSTNLQDLPPDHLEHFFSAGGGALAGSNKVISVAKPDEKYVKKDTGLKSKEKAQLISDDIKKTKYSRYESFKLNGDNFPLPQIDELENKISKKVVILTPITNEEDESGPQSEIKRQKISGDELLRNLLRKQSTHNFEQWLSREERKNSEDQSVILLLTV